MRRGSGVWFGKEKSFPVNEYDMQAGVVLLSREHFVEKSVRTWGTKIVRASGGDKESVHVYNVYNTVFLVMTVGSILHQH